MKRKVSISTLIIAALTLLAALSTLSVGAATAETPCAESDCSGAYQNGICSENHTHYEEPVLNNNGTDSVTSDDYYEIGNAGELLWFAALCNGIERTDSDNVYGDEHEIYHEYFIPYNAVLTSDITLNENLIVNGALTSQTEGLISWPQIGSYVLTTEEFQNIYDVDVYQGTFDGRGHAIRGLYANASKKNRLAMFCAIGDRGAVKNVSFDGTYLLGGNQVSTVAYVNYGKISNCKTYGIIYTGKMSGGAGICVDNYGEVEQCINYADVSGSNGAYFFGGIASENYGTIENCANLGTVSSKQTYGSGGLVYCNEGTIKSCYSNGTVLSSSIMTGGITVFNKENGVISDCYYNNTLASENTVYQQWGTLENTEGKEPRAFEGGEIAYLLGDGWGQTLGADPNPVFATESNKVYRSYTFFCGGLETSPIYSNTSGGCEEHHEYEEALAHDGSAKCAICGWFDRNSTRLTHLQDFIDAERTHLYVSHEVSNPAALRKDSATITLQGGFLEGEVTLGLFNGRLVTQNGDTVSYGEINEIGYVGAELANNLLSFKYAFPPANSDHPAGEAVTLSYTIVYYGEDGMKRQSSGELEMEYVSYGITTAMTEYGATLNLTFYSTRGTVIKESVYNVGSYSVTLADYYGGEQEYPYSIEHPQDIGTSITREDTEDGATITIERNDGNSIFVTLPEGTEGATVEGNGRPRVTLTLTESVKFSYKHVNYNGDEVVKHIAIDIQPIPQQKPILERLGYTTVDWNDESEYALAADNLTKHRVGKVTVYLTNCIFKSTRSMVYFTFTPGGVTTHTFSKDDILLIENGSEHALTEDVTVSLGGVLVDDHLFLDATCTAPKTCKICNHTEGEPAGHDMKPATCTAPATCKVCNHTEGEPAGHDLKAATCTAPATCEVCNHTEGEPAGHDMKAATCTAPATCKVCNHTEGEPAGHSYDNGCDPTCNACGEVRTPADHADEDKNLLCDACGAELPKAGLSGGAIAGIAVGSTAAAGATGVGIFSLIWFVIKKRTWSDLIGIFKK